MDASDLTSPKTLVRLDWGLLERLVYSPDEAKASALSSRSYEEMTQTYERYKRKWRS